MTDIATPALSFDTAYGRRIESLEYQLVVMQTSLDRLRTLLATVHLAQSDMDNLLTRIGSAELMIALIIAQITALRARRTPEETP